MSLNLRNMISGSSLRAISLARDGAADENNQLRVLDDDLSAGSSIASACIISFQLSQDVKSQYPRTNDLKSTSCIICSAARAALFPLITISTRAQSSFFPISAALSYNLRYISLAFRPTYCVYPLPDGSYHAGNFFARVFISFLAMYSVASDGFKLKFFASMARSMRENENPALKRLVTRLLAGIGQSASAFPVQIM